MNRKLGESMSEKQETQTPAFRVGPWQPMELRKQAEAAAAKSEFIDDVTNTAAFILGFEDGFKGIDPDSFIPGGYEKPYNAGFAEGTDARNNSDMLSNAIPARAMTLGALEDVDITCGMCGAVVKPDGTCDFCPVNCSACEAPLGDDGLCHNLDCSIHEEQRIQAEEQRERNWQQNIGETRAALEDACPICRRPLDEWGFCPDNSCPGHVTQVAI